MAERVYVSNAGLHDYSSLLDWSEDVEYVTVGDVDRMNPERLQLTIASKMKNFTEKDYLVFSGSPIPFALCLAYLFRKGFLSVRVLYWMRRTNSYFQVVYAGDTFDRAEKLAKETE